MPGMTELLFRQFLANQMKLLDNISCLVQSIQYNNSLHVYCPVVPVQLDTASRQYPQHHTIYSVQYQYTCVLRCSSWPIR